MMAAFIRVASACGVGRPLPLVLSAERVAAHLPDKASFHRLPAAMAVNKIFGHVYGGDAHLTEDGGAHLTEAGRAGTFVAALPTRPLVQLLTAAVYFFYLVGCAWLLLSSTLDCYHAVRSGRLSDRTILCWLAALVLSILAGGLILLFAVAFGLQMAWVLHHRRRAVQWYRLGERRFRVIERDELWHLHPFIRRTCRDTDPPVSCDFSSNHHIYRSFSEFALDTLLQRLGYRGRGNVVLDVTVGLRHAGYRALLQNDLSGKSDMFVIDLQVELWREPPGLHVPMRIVGLLLGGGSVVASVSLYEGQIVVRTSEAVVADGATVGERFPVTVAAVRQLLRSLGLENEAVGLLP
mmetsp:Transcript_17535/g.49781  ORF Transcript_17535/g.49781 Transcript_17535/m.49781 type:complete len:351 (-) Transcript_17535:2314-3366(-)